MDQLSRFHFQYFLYIFLAKMFTNIIPNSNTDVIVGVVSFKITFRGKIPLLFWHFKNTFEKN
jgi:hypothetical protein